MMFLSLRNRKSARDLNAILLTTSDATLASTGTSIANNIRRHSVALGRTKALTSKDMFTKRDQNDLGAKNGHKVHSTRSSATKSSKTGLSTISSNSNNTDTNGTSTLKRRSNSENSDSSDFRIDSGASDKSGESQKTNKDSQRAKRMLKRVARVVPSPDSETTLVSADIHNDSGSFSTVHLDIVQSVQSEDGDNDVFESDMFRDVTTYLTQFSDGEDLSSPAKLHRSVNISNMKELLANMDEHIVPLGSRKSVELEAAEIHDLQARLSTNDDLTIRLVENVVFVSFFEDLAHASIQRNLRTWDEIDVDDTLKLDAVVDEQEYMHM